MKRLANLVARTFLVLIMTVIVLSLANLACFAFFYFYPGTLEPDAERITREFNARFVAEQGSHAIEWLALESNDELQAFSLENSEHSVIGSVYRDFAHFMTAPWKGRFFNFHPEGFREVKNFGPWPPSPENYNVFFFGGSTTMGIGPDWATIASYFQARLEGQVIEGKPVKAYNFGHGSYFSTQERILFQQVLLEKHVPNMAIFIDGLNDFYFLDGRPSGWQVFAQLLRDHNEQALRPQNIPFRERVVKSLSYRTKALMLRLSSLSLGRMAQGIADRLFPSAAELPTYQPEEPNREQLEAVIDRYLENQRQIRGVSRMYGITPIFVWQPVPGYKYDLRYHIALNPQYGLGGHERSAYGYPVMAERRKASDLGGDFLWLADIQEDRREPLYMDAVHYTAKFSREIAGYIADFVVRRTGETGTAREEGRDSMVPSPSGVR